jgi:hypothetical protein
MTICEYKQIIIDLFKWNCATPTQWGEMAQAVLEASEAGKTPGIDEEFVLPEKYDYIHGLTDHEYKQIIIDFFKRGHATSTQWGEMAQAVLEASEAGKTPKIDEKLILQEKYDYICSLTEELVKSYYNDEPICPELINEIEEFLRIGKVRDRGG